MPNQNSSTTVTIVAHYRAQLSYSLMSSSIVMNPNLTFAQARASLSLGNNATVGPTHALQPGSVSELELWSLIKWSAIWPVADDPCRRQPILTR